MSHRFLFENLIGAGTSITASSCAPGRVSGAISLQKSGSGSVFIHGEYSGETLEVYTVEIDGAGETGAATFKWRKTSTAAGFWEASGVATAATDVALDNGVKVRFTDGASPPSFQAGDRRQATASRFYSPQQLYALDPATQFRTDSPPSDPAFLALDLGVAGAPDAALVHLHNISESGTTIRIQGSPFSFDQYSYDSDGAITGTISAHADWNLTGAVSVIAIVNPDALADKFLVCKYKLAGDECPLIFETQAEGSFRLRYKSAGGSWFTTPSTEGVMTAGSFGILGVTRNAAGDDVNYYYDGSPLNNPSGPGTPSAGNGQDVYLFRNWADADKFAGKVQRILVYGRELSAAEMAAFAAGTDPDATSLIADFRCQEGSGSTLEDSSGGGHDAALSASGAWSRDLYHRLSETLTWASGTMLRYLTTSPRSYRYWRLLIEGGAANADGHIEIAEMYWGATSSPSTTSSGGTSWRRRPSRSSGRRRARRTGRCS